MHWLADRVATVASLAPDPGASSETGGRRHAFLEAVSALVEESSRREGIDAVFACYDGLLIATAGSMQSEAEPLAALAQSTMDPLRVGLLGPIQQLLLVGEERKLALLRVGPVTVGLLSRSDVRLSSTTAR